MSKFGTLMRIVGVAGGLLFVGSQSVTAEGSGVIRDREWTIKIRSKRSTERSVPADRSQNRNVNVTPAVYQQPEPGPAPATASDPTKPANNGVQPAPEPVPTPNNGDAGKSVGPRLGPANNSDPADTSVGSPLELVPSVLPLNLMNYEQAYAAVPFSRTEYEANPTYRHQAAMELLFRTLRPTTIVQNYTPRAIRYPDSYQVPYGRSDTQHINIRNFGGGTNYNGQSPFGYPYGLKGNW